MPEYGDKVDSTRRLAAGLPAQPTDPYWALVWVNVWGTLLTITPLLAVYAYVFDITAHQGLWLGGCVLVALVVVLAQDLWMIRRHSAPLRHALDHGGAENWRAALVCALNYPLTSVRRTYGPHVLVPMTLFSGLAVGVNLALDLGLPFWMLAVTYCVGVAGMPLIHAFIEYFVTQRTLLPIREYAEAVLGGSPDPGPTVRRVSLGVKLVVPFITVALAPLLIVAVTVAIRAQLVVEDAAVNLLGGEDIARWSGHLSAAGTWTGATDGAGPEAAPILAAARAGTHGVSLPDWLVHVRPGAQGDGWDVVAVPRGPLSQRRWTLVGEMALTGIPFVALSIFLWWYFVVSEVHERTGALLRALDRVGQGDLEHPPRVTATDEFGDLAKGIRGAMGGLKEREKLQDLFGRHTNPDVVKLLMTQKERLGGTRQEATILFSDIRNFTKMSERMEPEDVVALLNRYLDGMVRAIHAHKGRIDKFIGDGILAVFGYPVADADHVANTVRAALAMREELARLNVELRAERRPELAFGVGIHTGPVLCGSIGSHDRLEFTVIGDVVNTASRVEGLTKKLECDVVVTGRVQAATRDLFEYEHRAPEEVKGKTMALEVFVLRAAREPPVRPAR